MTTIIEKIKKGIEAVINTWRNKLIAFKKWLERVRTAILSKILIKLSNHVIEGYSHQLTGIGERIDEFNKKLPPENDLKKIVKISNAAQKIHEDDLKEISDFLNKIPKEDRDKIAILANASHKINGQDVKKISKLFKKFSKEELEKTEILAKTERVIRKDYAKAIFEFLSKTSKKDLEKMALFTGTSKLPEINSLERSSEQVVSSDERRKEFEKKMKERREELEREGLSSGLARIILGIEVLEERTMPNEEIERITHRGEGREFAEDIETSYKKGVIFLKMRKYEEAYVIFSEIAENLNLKGAWLNKGIAAGRLGRILEDGTHEEIYCYRQALSIDRNYASALANLALAYERMGDIYESNRYFDELKALRGR